MKTLSLLILFVLSTTTSAKTTSSKLIIGVGTHFGQSASYFPYFSDWSNKAGITSFRDEIYWSNVEKKKNKFVLTGGAATTFDAIIRSRAYIKPLIILNYGNELYGNGGLPKNLESIRAFGRYVKWIVSTTKKYTDIYELWNEWNIGMGSREKHGSEISYVNLAKHTYKVIKKVDNNAKLLVGALAKDKDWKWLESSIKLGLLEYADGLSIHLYNHCNKRKIGSDELVLRIDLLSQMLHKYGFEELPIYITEIGWPVRKENCGVTQEYAASQILRSLLEISLREEIKGVWIYEFMDRSKYKYKDYGFGLLSKEGSELKSGCIVRKYSNIIKKRPIFSVEKEGLKAAIYSSLDSNYIFIWDKQGVKTKHKKILRYVSLSIKNGKTAIESNKNLLGSKVMKLCGVMSGKIEFVSFNTFAVSIYGDFPLIIKVSKNIDSVSII